MTTTQPPRDPEPTSQPDPTTSHTDPVSARQPVRGGDINPIVVWINPDLRARHPELPPSLAEACTPRPHPQPRRQARTQRQPDRELEAEP